MHRGSLPKSIIKVVAPYFTIWVSCYLFYGKKEKKKKTKQLIDARHVSHLELLSDTCSASHQEAQYKHIQFNICIRLNVATFKLCKQTRRTGPDCWLYPIQLQIAKNVSYLRRSDMFHFSEYRRLSAAARVHTMPSWDNAIIDCW